MARILLVDDDIAEISAVKRVLSRAGHQPVLATNASDAQTAIEYQCPDLVIIGATCEGGRGIELTRLLAEADATANVPLIVLGNAPDAAPTASQLPRPVDPAQLSEFVKAAVGEGTAPQPAPPARRPSPAVTA
ncbi:MAG: response regulator, partial [Anaeromyxobacteraceae bacterium]